MSQFAEDGVLPPGDYELSIADLKESMLVVGPRRGSRAARRTWDQAWMRHPQGHRQGRGIDMIRNDAEHKKAIERIAAECERIEALRHQLEIAGLGADEVNRAIEPIQSFHLQLVEEVDEYERLKRGEFADLVNFHGVGRLLVSLRIHRGLTQREFADRLGVHESQVSRDERNEYHGITVSRVARLFEILGVRLHTTVETVGPHDCEFMAS